MLILENNSSFHKKQNISEKKVTFKKSLSQTATYLSNKFIISCDLQDSNDKLLKHLKKIFLYFLEYKIEKINLKKTLNIDNSIRLEFVVYTSYINKPSCNVNFNKNTKIFSIDKYFKDNYKYIIT